MEVKEMPNERHIWAALAMKGGYFFCKGPDSELGVLAPVPELDNSDLSLRAKALLSLIIRMRGGIGTTCRDSFFNCTSTSEFHTVCAAIELIESGRISIAQLEYGESRSSIAQRSTSGRRGTTSDDEDGAQKDDEGSIYVASNPSMAHLKIGRTTQEPEDRLASLSDQTGIPQPFELEHAERVDTHRKVERAAHELLSDCRVSDSREFFDCDVGTAVDAIKTANEKVNGNE